MSSLNSPSLQSSAPNLFLEEARRRLSAESSEESRIEALVEDLERLLSASPAPKKKTRNSQASKAKNYLKPLAGLPQHAVELPKNDLEITFHGQSKAESELWAYFEKSLPHHPYCAQEKDSGTCIRSRRCAIHWSHIQVNSPFTVKWLILDVDKPDQHRAWEWLDLPRPHLTIINPESRHSQWLYRLETPVHMSGGARSGPKNYLRRIVQAFANIEGLGVDPCFRGPLSKNPMHPRWQVIVNPVPAYDLAYIAEHLPDSAFDVKQPEKGSKWRQEASTTEQVTEGHRNVSLFDRVRLDAYGAIAKYRNLTRQQWVQYVEEVAKTINKTFSPPLPDREARGVAKSVSGWVWAKHDPSLAADHSQLAREAQRLGAKARRSRREAQISEAIEILTQTGERITVSSVALLIGCAERTIQRYLHLLPKRQKRTAKNPAMTVVAGQNTTFTSVLAPGGPPDLYEKKTSKQDFSLHVEGDTQENHKATTGTDIPQGRNRSGYQPVSNFVVRSPRSPSMSWARGPPKMNLRSLFHVRF